MSGLKDILPLLLTAGLWQATLTAAILLLLPAVGGVISVRSGVVNIAMEGMMLMAAFFAVWADLQWHNPLLATLVAMVAGAGMALIHGVISIRFTEALVVGAMEIHILAAGL